MPSRRLVDLTLPTQKLYYAFELACDNAGLDFVLTCTLRTLEEQKILVKQKKSKTMNSKHLTGEAFDIMVIKNGKPTWVFTDYLPYGAIGRDVGLKWGGDWKRFKDGCHFEITEE